MSIGCCTWLYINKAHNPCTIRLVARDQHAAKSEQQLRVLTRSWSTPGQPIKKRARHEAARVGAPSWPGDTKLVKRFDAACQVVVYNVAERPIPIVHRIVRIHKKKDSSVDVLTKVTASFGLYSGIRLRSFSACDAVEVP